MGFALSDPLLIRLPPFISVSLCISGYLLHIIGCTENPPANNNHVAIAIVNHLARSPVLLAHTIALAFQPNAGGQDKEIIVPHGSLHCDETYDKAPILAGHLYRLL